MYLLLVNPKAGNQLFKRIERRFVSLLNRHQIKHKLIIVDDLANTAELLSQNLKPDPKAVIAVGGNGTVTSVIDALADYDLPFGVIPTDRSNHLAHLLGIRDWQAGIRALAKPEVRNKRLGKIGQRYFLGDLLIAPKRNLIKKVWHKGSPLKRFFGANLTINPKSHHSVASTLKLDSSLEVRGALTSLTVQLLDEESKRLRVNLKTVSESGEEPSVFLANQLEIESSLNMPIVSGDETLANTPATIRATSRMISVLYPVAKKKVAHHGKV